MRSENFLGRYLRANAIIWTNLLRMSNRKMSNIPSRMVYFDIRDLTLDIRGAFGVSFFCPRSAGFPLVNRVRPPQGAALSDVGIRCGEPGAICWSMGTVNGQRTRSLPDMGYGRGQPDCSNR